MLGFWGLVLLVGILRRSFGYIFANCDQLSEIVDPESRLTNRPTGTNRKIINRCNAFLRKYIFLPAMFGFRHQESFGWYTVPTRGEGMVVSVFVALNIIFLSVSYTAFTGDLK
jgi:hypothetical protein